jgi:hypothetical protein
MLTPAISPILGPQNPAQEMTMSAGMRSSPHEHGAHAAACGVDARHRGPIAELDAGAAGALDDEARPLQRQREAVAGRPEAAEHGLGIDHREQPAALVGVDHVRLDAPGPVPARPAVQILQPLGSGRELEPADGKERSDAVGSRQLRVLLDGLLREGGHRLRGVRREHETRGVRRGPAGCREGALLEHERVREPALGELVGEVRADDAGSDDDDAWGGAHEALLQRVRRR